MAVKPNSTALAVWHHLVNLREELIHNLKSASGSRCRELETRLAALEEQLLDQPAPDLKGATLKLELLWAASLHGLDRDSRQRSGVLEDLRRLGG